MKLPHVIVLSIVGMLVASLSVLVFTSPRGVFGVDEPCSFFIDGRLVKLENDVPLMGLALRPRVGVAEAVSKLVQMERNRESLSTGKQVDFTCRQGCLDVVLANLGL